MSVTVFLLLCGFPCSPCTNLHILFGIISGESLPDGFFLSLVYRSHCQCVFLNSCRACLPSACEWKTTTETAAGGWKGLLISSSSLAAEKAGESVGSSFSVMLAGRAGSRASMGAMMQWDSRHSGLTLKTKTKQQQQIL